MPVLNHTRKQARLEYVALVKAKCKLVPELPTYFCVRLLHVIGRQWPQRLHNSPAEKHCEAIVTWILGFRDKETSERAVCKFRELQTHLAIHDELIAAAANATLSEAEERLRASVMVSLPAPLKELAPVFARALADLRKQSSTHDLVTCGDVSLPQAVDFTFPWRNMRNCCAMRQQLLHHTGFRYGRELQAELDACKLLAMDYQTMNGPQRVIAAFGLHNYWRLQRLLGVRPRLACKSMSVADFVDRFEGLGGNYEGTNVQQLFTFVLHELKFCNRDETIHALNLKVSPAISTLSYFDWFSGQSEWCRQSAEQMFGALKRQHTNTHFTEQYANKLKT